MNLRPILVSDVVVSIFVGHHKPGKWYSMAGAGAKGLAFILLWSFVSAIQACVTPRSAVRSDIAPSESRTLIGFDAHGAMILLGESADRRTLYAFDLPRGPERALDIFESPISDADVRSLIKEQGWRAAETWTPNGELALSFQADASIGERRFMTVRAEAGEVSLVLERVPIRGEARIEQLARSPDARFVIIELSMHAMRSVLIFDVADAAAALYNLRALDAHAKGDHRRAAELLERAVALNPRAADAIYNLACVHALAGDVARAADELAIAIQLDPARYRRLASRDPDLAAVWPLVRPEGAPEKPPPHTPH